MAVTVRKYGKKDIAVMMKIWNEVVKEADAFPQLETLEGDEGERFFAAQTYCGVAELDGEAAGMYILHPNNVGRCGHIANASYAVNSKYRGNGIGRVLVEDCLKQGKEHGFKILQFNAVVASNTGAIKLYEKLGFVKIGTVAGGFKNGDGIYEDIILFYHTL